MNAQLLNVLYSSFGFGLIGHTYNILWMTNIFGGTKKGKYDVGYHTQIHGRQSFSA